MSANSGPGRDKPKVVFFQRKPLSSGNYSIEFLFADLRTRLRSRIDARVVESTFHSHGALRRLFNAIEVIFCQGDVNIVTGDIQYVATFLRKQKTILIVLDCGFLHRSHGMRRRIQEWIWYRIPMSRAKCVVTISEFTKREILENFDVDPSAVTVIPVWIGKDFKPAPQPFNKEKATLLQVGQAQNKNLFRIIDAIKDLPVRLAIVGQLTSATIDLLNENNIDFTNSVNLSISEMVQAYIESDMLVFPSTYEGFGMPILEAQAVGRPVVTSVAASMPWVAGEAACLVDPLSTSSIRDGVIKIIEDDSYRNDLISRGFQNIKRFDPDRISQMHYELINEVFVEGRH